MIEALEGKCFTMEKTNTTRYFSLYFVSLVYLAFCALGCSPSAQTKDAGIDDHMDSGPSSGSDSSIVNGEVIDSGPPICGESAFMVESVPINMLIVLDRSNSMCQTSTPTLWRTMGEALTEVTIAMEHQINFGLMLFPDMACTDGSPTQCAGSTVPYVPIGAVNAAQAIAAAVHPSTGVGCCGGTPTADTLTGAGNYMASIDDGLQKYVLLATDGAPNCNLGLTWPCTCTWDNCDVQPLNCLDDTRTINAAQALNNASIPVFVLGVGDANEWAQVMNDIAAAGGTSSYYSVTDTTQLLATFQVITESVVSCEFELDWDSLPPEASSDPALVNIYCKAEEDEPIGPDNLIGLDVECADGSGWDWVDENRIRLCPGGCDSLTSGDCKIITATFGCESVVVK